MPDRYDPSPSALAEPYSPQRRTALVLTGTGTAGAYHAGVLRALHEAGVKLDIVAGRGIGVVGALVAPTRRTGSRRRGAHHGRQRSDRRQPAHRAWRLLVACRAIAARVERGGGALLAHDVGPGSWRGAAQAADTNRVGAPLHRASGRQPRPTRIP